MNRAIKYRVYPDDEQMVLFLKTFGCCRKVWNLMLAGKKDGYAKDGKFPALTPAMYKDEYPYLREVDSLALANVQLNLQKALADCRKVPGRGFPKFKTKRHSRKSYTTNNQNGTVAVGDGYIRLPKAGKVKAVIHRAAPDEWKLKSATVSVDAGGAYYCSLLYEYEEPEKPVLVEPANPVGIDYKNDGLGYLSNGEILGSPKQTQRNAKRLARAQRKLSKMVGSRKGEHPSNNFLKQHKRVGKIHRKITNTRKDDLHKKSASIAKRFDFVAVESLNMKAMSNKAFGNGKATMDNGYGMFLFMLEYKLRDNGGVLMRVDKWYPSSQLCSVCGYQNRKVKDLSVRTWMCPLCGTVHDRDGNAAENILHEGLRLYKEGAAV